MNKLLLLLPLLTGCGMFSDPHPAIIDNPAPTIPAALLQPCPDLSLYPDIGVIKMANIADNTMYNMRLYYDCKDKIDALIKWQNAIQDSVIIGKNNEHQ